MSIFAYQGSSAGVKNTFKTQKSYKERNPRKADRKRQYTEEDREKIRNIRGQGRSIREIAKETGCSVGYVQGILSDPKNRCSEINY